MEENREFLQGYEMKTWDFSPRIYKIIASAAIFNLLSLAIIGQADLLQTKACNSPLISKVCSVLDTVYVGSKLLSGDKDYVVKEYNKTEIGDADPVWVDTTGETPQIQYPEGYFQIANRDELAMLESLDSQFTTEPSPFGNSPLPPMSPSPSTSTPPPFSPSKRNNSIFDKAQKLPKKRKSTIIGDLPDNPLGENKDDKDDKTGKKPDDKSIADKEAEDKKNQAQKELEDKSATKSDSVNAVEINKKPLQDFADDIVVKWSKKEIDLTKNFAVRINATIKGDGTFDPKKTNFVGQQGDEDIVNVAKSAIEAVGNSGFLAYLVNLDISQVQITLVQDGEKLYATVISNQKTPEQAKTKASGLNGVISFGKLSVKGEDEKVLLNSAKVSSEGKTIRINVNIPKPIASEMMNRKLQEALVKKNNEQKGTQPTPKQPNGTAVNKVINDKISK